MPYQRRMLVFFAAALSLLNAQSKPLSYTKPTWYNIVVIPYAIYDTLMSWKGEPQLTSDHTPYAVFLTEENVHSPVGPAQGKLLDRPAVCSPLDIS